MFLLFGRGQVDEVCEADVSAGCEEFVTDLAGSFWAIIEVGNFMGQWLLARRRDDSEGGSRDVQSMKGIILKFGTGTGIEYVNNWMRLVSSYYG